MLLLLMLNGALKGTEVLTTGHSNVPGRCSLPGKILQQAMIFFSPSASELFDVPAMPSFLLCAQCFYIYCITCQCDLFQGEQIEPHSSTAPFKHIMIKM